MLRPALLVSVLAAAAVAGTASAAPGRTATVSYAGATAPKVVVAGTVLPTLPQVTVLSRRVGGSSFDTVRGERTVRVAVVDDAGAEVGARVTQQVAGRTVELGAFCGRSEPLRLAAPGAPVRVILTLACGTPTTGSLSVAFR